MAESLNVYACRNCENLQYAKEKPMNGCDKCGGFLSVVEGVQVTVSEEETKKYAHELSKQSRHNSAKESILSTRH